MEDTDPGPIILSLLPPQASIYIGFPIEAVFSLLVIVVLLLFSGLISGSEIAFFSLSPSEHQDLLNGKTKSNKIASNILHVPKKLLAAILISNNFINIGVVLLSTIFTQNVFDFSQNQILGLVVQVVVITAILLLVGEIMPKIFARQRPMLFINIMARPLEFVMIIFKPLIALLSTTTNIIDKRLAKHKPQLSMKELTEAIELTGESENSKVEEEDQKILKGIATFGDTDVKEIMKARVDVKAIEKSTDFKDVIAFIQEWGYSRVPIFNESLDQIEGILYIKDLLSFLDADDYNWKTKIRPAFFVPENKKINDLLQEFRSKKIHLAIVVDEYGGTSGIVSLEDVLEEIVGEISDEFDVENEEFVYKQVNDNTWVFEAKSGLLDVCKVIDVDSEIFDEVKGESDSLAGLILELKGNFPEEDEILHFENIEFKILKMEKRRISRVRIKKMS
jgi:gliding motility-associated protein GldE